MTTNFDTDLTKAYDGCGCATCKKLDVTCDQCPDCGNDMGKADACDCATCKEDGMTCDKCEKCMSKGYISDDEHVDKWNNMEKSCWSGYRQDGMKDKNGKQVPNCVPVKKSADEPDAPKSWGGAFRPSVK